MRRAAAGLLCAWSFSATAQTPDTANTLPPVGFGSLRQADVAILLRLDAFQMSILPLDERIIRLLSPDTYQSLHALQTAREAEIRAASPLGGAPGRPFLVTVYASRDQASFDPERLTITSNNRYFRPVEILPLSPRWSEQQLEARETASALYLFDWGLDPLKPMIVEYGRVVDTSWEDTVRRLETERARVEARARGARHP